MMGPATKKVRMHPLRFILAASSTDNCGVKTPLSRAQCCLPSSSNFSLNNTSKMDVAPWAYKWTDWMGWMTQIQTDKETEMEKDIDQKESFIF